MTTNGQHDHDRGLAFDLSTLIHRRHALKLLAGVGALALVGCGDDDDSLGGSSSTTGARTTTGSTDTTGAVGDGSCSTIPQETGGPFPADGTNGPNVLTEDGIVRSDIRSSYGSASGTASGVPLTVDLFVQEAGTNCVVLENAAVYLWHCDQGGLYSLYSRGAENENYLRGVQAVDTIGRVNFQTIFPAAYSGRWPHIHFEVYASLSDATGGEKPLITSQLALPKNVCEAVYASDGYEQSVRNLAQTSLDRDMVFSDGSNSQLATVSGDVATGFSAQLAVPV